MQFIPTFQRKNGKLFLNLFKGAKAWQSSSANKRTDVVCEEGILWGALKTASCKGGHHWRSKLRFPSIEPSLTYPKSSPKGEPCCESWSPYLAGVLFVFSFWPVFLCSGVAELDCFWRWHPFRGRPYQTSKRMPRVSRRGQHTEESSPLPWPSGEVPTKGLEINII